MKKRFCAALLSACLLLSAGACAPQREKMSDSLEAMDTFMTIEVYGASGNELSSVRANIEALDKRLSVTNEKGEDNEIFRVNQNGAGMVSPDVADLAEQALTLCRETDGALDITVLPVVEEWGFISKNYHIPTAERLAKLLPLVDYTQVSCKNNTLKLNKSGMKLDFGAVAKGYIADKATDILRSADCKSAILNLGGTIAAFGEKQNGQPWRVGIADPDNSATFMGYLSCKDKIIATSGSYERSFAGADGKVYSHIIDPKTGIPVDNGILSVTIISDSGVRSDGLSTALFVMGRDRAETYYRRHSGFDYVMLTADKKAYVTAGAAESFTVAQGYDYEIVRIS